MKPIKVFDIIYKRKIVFFGFTVGLIIIASIVISANFFGNSRKAKAVDFEASTSKLVVPENTLLYIGGSGYPSQRLWSQIGEPINPSHQLPSDAVIPPDHVYNSRYSAQECWPGVKDVWGIDLTNCYLIIGDNTGMILRYTDSIDIYGTVIIGDRVVLDAPNIKIHIYGKIYANGQDNQLGYGDNACGAGGIGGINGGTNANSLVGSVSSVDRIFPHCIDKNTVGGPSTNPAYPLIVAGNILALNNDVRPYFAVNSTDITGGRGSDSSRVFATGTTLPGLGANGAIGVGGGGSGGSTGTTGADDHASSGGGGGGFGIVFQSQNLEVNSNATITASGGNSWASVDGTSQYPGHGHNPSGAFGGPGGGGVIVVNSPLVSFRFGADNQTEAPANFAIFNVKGGILKFPEEFNPNAIWTDGSVKTPPGANDGKLVVNAGSGIVSIKKTVSNAGSYDPDEQARPDYVFRSGDHIVVTLYLFNLTPGTKYKIEDEIFSDGVNLGSTVDVISEGGTQDGLKVTWPSVVANDSTGTKTVLMYMMTVR